MKKVSVILTTLLLAASSSHSVTPPPGATQTDPIIHPPTIEAPATQQPKVQAPVHTDSSLKIYKVHHADPAQVATIIPVMMPSTNGLVLQTVDRNIVVRGTPEQHQIVKELLRELDAPPKNIQINVDFGSSGQTFDREASLRPQGSIVIRNGEVHGTLRGRFSNQSSTSRENTGQMLVAADGKSASLRVGEQVPHIAWLTEYGYRHGYVREIAIEWRDFGSFLAMEPTIPSPGLIRIRLIPEVSGRLKDGTRQRIKFTHLATEVVVRDGQTISIGGFNTDQEFSSRFFGGNAHRGETSFTGITLTPQILQ